MKRLQIEKIEDIYHATIDQPPESRTEFLDEACGGDEALRREIESLLPYDNASSDFIDSPPAFLAAEMFVLEGEKHLLIDGRINHYKIERLIGEGGMGEVYLAEDTRLHRRVALKVLPQSIVGDAERLMRFEREAWAASALNHPNILTIHEFGEDDGLHFIASEFVDGLTLRNKLTMGSLELAEAFDIAIQVTSALSAAHEAGITHRDIKPENIMIRRDGYVKVLDFGLAKLTQKQDSSTSAGSEDLTAALHRTKPGAIMGTAGYMSPEQARGRHVDARTDIWSLGAVTYEMLSGRRPFAGETSADIIVSVLSSEPPPLSSYVKDLPAELDWVIAKALSKNVDARYQTSKELRADLERIKKRIEFDDNLSRSKGAESQIGKTGLDEKAHSTAEPGTPTAGNGAGPTDDGRDESSQERSFSISASFADVVFTQVQDHRLRSSLVAVLIFALASSAVYLIFLAPRASAQIDSIAVLPFENLSGNPDLAYVSDGLSESLIDRLSQLPQLKVISRNSSFKFRGANIDVRDAASRMGARAIVTGSVTRVNGDLAVRMDIVDTAENRHLAGGQYRRKVDDLIRFPNEIAQSAADQLRLKLTESQTKRITENGTENSEAYRYYLSGLVAMNGDEGVRSRALEYFEKAVELDPGFAAAHTEIAWMYWLEANGSGNPHELMPKARAATERALAIDPNHAKAHCLQAMVNEYEFDWKGAEAEYKRCIELSPNLDFARNNYAFFLSIMGRQDESLAELEEQRLRDPINRRLGFLQKGIVLTQARRFDDALAAYQEAQAVEPAKQVPGFALGYTYAGKALYNEAAGYYRDAVDVLGGGEKYSQPLVYLAAAYAKVPGKQAEARAILARVEAMRGYKSPAILAVGYSALDDHDKAMELLEEAYIKRDLLLRFIGTGYEYDGLRRDPRFVDLTKRSGLTQ